METITNLVSTVGFPITVSLIAFFYIYKSSEKQSEETKVREERMLNQIDNFNETLKNFNATLVSLDARLESIEETVKNNIKEG